MLVDISAVKKSDRILKIRLQKILEANLYCTLATLTNLKTSTEPWISNVFFAVDEKFNLYWYSRNSTQHSQNIESNCNIAISIFDSTKVGDQVDAIYLKAEAHEVQKLPELRNGLVTYAKKAFATLDEQHGFVSGIKDFRLSSELRLYKAVIKEAFLLAPSVIYNGKYLDYRQDITELIK